MSDEKTEEPTHKKLEDAKKQGQHPKSQDMGTALSLLAMTICLSSAGGMAADRIMAIISRMLDSIGKTDSDTQLTPMLAATVVDGIVTLLPFIGVSFLAGIIGQAAQIGLNITFEPLTPKFDKVNPASGLKKLISMKSVIEFIKTIIKAIAIVAVLWTVIRGLLPLLMGSAYLTAPAIVAVGWAAVMKVLGGVLLVFFVIGPVDFGLQKYLFIKDQKMSKDEVKREHKESEGDPQLKGKRKQLAHEMANSATPKQAVPGASVVVTNPTHYAVAIRYKAGETALPIVVAKGVDGEALLIRMIAEEHNVPVVSQPSLARALFTLPLQASIPEKLFDAVAAVLRWVQFVKGGSKLPAPRT
ncbi:MAG: type III secretion system export apparatus subunit SctU [Burkholderiales bacterium]|nr:type III secretion system export apparatus subunit SctU [Burkholderiales bacterium]